MTPIVSAAVVLSLAASPLRAQAVAPPAAEDWDARLTEVQGTVTVYEAGGDPEGVPADKDMPLEAGDRVVTGSDGSAEVAFDAEHVVSLRSNSDFALTSARKTDTQLTLAVGSLLAKVSALLQGQSLRVRAPTAVAAVRGTEFAVEASGEESFVGVFDEGRVEVQSDSGGPAELLMANQETKIGRGLRPLPAYQLQRFIAHRRFMRAFRRRPLALRKVWRGLAPQARRELRRQVFLRRLEHRRKLRERLQQRQDGSRGREVPERLRRQREKMERRREMIRQRRDRP